MTHPPSDIDPHGSERHALAADWFARLQGDASSIVWNGFQTWLEEDPLNAVAYAEVERLWVELESPAIIWPQAGNARVAWVRQRAFWAGVTAAAAAVALAVFIPATLSRYANYSTAKGGHLAVTLKDGSRLVLSGDTHLRVRLSGKQRDAELASGEVTFDIVHDKKRPFVVAAGDHEVRVLGTNFDVKRQDALLAVTVRRGLVTVQDGHAQSAPIHVGAGQQYKLSGTSPPAIRQVDPEDAFAWTSGRLIYASAPLSEVAADLSRYLEIPLRVDADARDIPVSAVLKIDKEAAMIDRLRLFIPIEARKTDSEIVLTARAARR